MTFPVRTSRWRRLVGDLGRLPQLGRRVARVSPREILTTGRVAVLFGLAEVSVRLRPIAWSADRFGVALVAPAGSESGMPDPLTPSECRGVRAVQRLSPRIYGSERGCLRRSLVLGHVLRARRPVMRIGVRRDASSSFAAHAWIEIDGDAIEHGNEGYLAFDFDR